MRRRPDRWTPKTGGTENDADITLGGAFPRRGHNAQLWQRAPVQGVVHGTAEVGQGAVQGTAQAGKGLAQGTATVARGAGQATVGVAQGSATVVKKTGKGAWCIVTLRLRLLRAELDRPRRDCPAPLLASRVRGALVMGQAARVLWVRARTP